MYSPNEWPPPGLMEYEAVWQYEDGYGEGRQSIWAESESRARAMYISVLESMVLTNRKFTIEATGRKGREL